MECNVTTADLFFFSLTSIPYYSLLILYTPSPPLIAESSASSFFFSSHSLPLVEPSLFLLLLFLSPISHFSISSSSLLLHYLSLLSTFIFLSDLSTSFSLFSSSHPSPTVTFLNGSLPLLLFPYPLASPLHLTFLQAFSILRRFPPFLRSLCFCLILSSSSLSLFLFFSSFPFPLVCRILVF